MRFVPKSPAGRPGFFHFPPRREILTDGASERLRREDGVQMDIQGLQKLTLLDWPGRTACTVFLSGCDFRCPFCHNSELVEGPAPSAVPETELLAFLQKRRGILDGVCVTGGEPLLRPGLGGLLEKIKALGYPVKLDTNGSHPEQLRALTEQGLVDYVAMDVKNCPERYAETAGVQDLPLEKIQATLDFLFSGAVDYELRTTVVRQFHDEAAIKSLAKWIRGAKRYYLQAFIDRDTVPFRGLEAYSKEEMEALARAARPFVPSVEVRGI